MDSLLFYKKSVSESNNNTETEFVLYTGDWNVTINSALDNKKDLAKIYPRTRRVITEKKVMDNLLDVCRQITQMKELIPNAKATLIRESGLIIS